MLRSVEDEFHLRLVPSVIHKGKRVRAVYNKLYFRPPTETFHEFLCIVLRETFGEDWWHEQQSLQREKQHVVIRWSKTVATWLAKDQTEKRQVSEGHWVARICGEAQSILQLGFDLLCLMQKDSLPESMIQKLRNHRGFQGVRYEVCVASIFARAGFRIHFCEDENDGEKLCEFVASHASGTAIAVEAKSRHRPGVLNQKGSPSEEYKADFEKLYAKARKKKPDLPFVIFIDANLPPEPEVPWENSPRLPEIMAIFDQFPQPTLDRPDPHNMVVITNYGSYYFGDGPSKLHPALYVESTYPTRAIPNVQVLPAIKRAVDRYAAIPEEV